MGVNKFFLILWVLISIVNAQVSDFPHKTTFESHTLGPWEQSLQDNTDWILHTGSTPTANTGPYFAYNGKQYLYLEATGNYGSMGFLDVYADFGNISNPFLTFGYHMYGAKMGTLKVQYSLDGINFTDIWSETGNKGNYWHHAGIDLSILSGQFAYIRIRGEVGMHFLSDIAIDELCLSDGGSCDPLPIELLYFDAKIKNNKVICNWITATEINTDYFVIQRTINGIDFEDVGIIKAAGNSFNNISYEFEDPSPLDGISYYRLKQYDLDGKNEAFGLVEVKHNVLNIKTTQYNDHIQIVLPHKTKFRILLYDRVGKAIINKEIEEYHELILNNLPKGIYFLIIQGGSNMYKQQIGIY